MTWAPSMSTTKPIRNAIGEAAVEAAWEDGRAMTLDQAVANARQEA